MVGWVNKRWKKGQSGQHGESQWRWRGTSARASVYLSFRLRLPCVKNIPSFPPRARHSLFQVSIPHKIRFPWKFENNGKNKPNFVTKTISMCVCVLMFRFQIIQDKNLFLLPFFFLYYYGLGLASLDAFLSLKMWEPLKLFEMEEIDRAQFWVLCRSFYCQKESLLFRPVFFRKSDGPAFFTPSSHIAWLHHPAFYGSTWVKKLKIKNTLVMIKLSLKLTRDMRTLFLWLS